MEHKPKEVDMNTIIAQGSPGSLIRRFQDEPQLGVSIYNALIFAEQVLTIENKTNQSPYIKSALDKTRLALELKSTLSPETDIEMLRRRAG